MPKIVWLMSNRTYHWLILQPSTLRSTMWVMTSTQRRSWSRVINPRTTLMTMTCPLCIPRPFSRRLRPFLRSLNKGSQPKKPLLEIVYHMLCDHQRWLKRSRSASYTNAVDQTISQWAGSFTTIVKVLRSRTKSYRLFNMELGKGLILQANTWLTVSSKRSKESSHRARSSMT